MATPRSLLLTAATLLAFPAFADDRCAHHRDEAPSVDIAGIERVVIEIGTDDLTVTAGAPQLAVRHCASTADRLTSSEWRIERNGGTLRMSSSNPSFSSFNWFKGNDYLYRTIQLSLPAALPVTLHVGSGDARITERSSVTVDLGSGDVALTRIGHVNADVGSGDVHITRSRSARVEVGSGDAILEQIEGAVRVDVGSGDATLRHVGKIDNAHVGSGEIVAEQVAGDAVIDDIGSGDVVLIGVGGNVRVGGIGSGDLTVGDVDGDLLVDDDDTLESIQRRGVRGHTIVGG